MPRTERSGAAEILATRPLPALPGSAGVPPALSFLDASEDAGETPALPGRPGRGGDLVSFAAGRRFATILADPPWQFANKTGKVAPEHRRLSRYGQDEDALASGRQLHCAYRSGGRIGLLATLLTRY